MLDTNHRDEFTIKLLNRYLAGLRYHLKLETSFEEVYEEIGALLDEVETTIRYPPKIYNNTLENNVLIEHRIGHRCLREVYNKSFYAKRVQRIRRKWEQLREKVSCLKVLACTAKSLQEFCDPTDTMRSWAQRADIVEDFVDIVFREMPYYYDLITPPNEC